MAGKLVRLNTTRQQSEEDYASQDDRMRLMDLEECFGFRFAKEWKLHKNGGTSRVGSFQGAHHDHKGTKLSYDPCPAPIRDRKTGEEGPCTYRIEPKDSNGKLKSSREMQVEAIIHGEKHWTWWLEENKQTTENDGPENDGRPPKTVVINLPEWVPEGEDDNYASMTNIERDVYDAKNKDIEEIKNEREELKREAAANKKIRNEVEEKDELVAVGADEPKRGPGRPKKEKKEGDEF